MREILKMIELFNCNNDKDEKKQKTKEEEDHLLSSLPLADKKVQEIDKNWNCNKCTYENKSIDKYCQMCNNKRIIKSKITINKFINSHGKNYQKYFQSNANISHIEEIVNFCHLIDNDSNIIMVRNIADNWNIIVKNIKKTVNHDGYLLWSLGTILDNVFETTNTSKQLIYRQIVKPDRSAKNRDDMLITVLDDNDMNKDNDIVDESTQLLPIYVTKAKTTMEVIEVVLSIYVRRGRLPQPGEILFCTTDTTLEEIELIIRRFIKAAIHGRNDYIFCIADIHTLSYTMQCSTIEILRKLMDSYGINDAARLVFVSGIEKQVILNSLSNCLIDLAPLDHDTLKKALAEVFSIHLGFTKAILSNVNGGGKSHHIMKLISQKQLDDPTICYRRISYRENSNTTTLVNLLKSYNNDIKKAVHLDIGHIIPANANTLLFELLIMGILNNKKECSIYNRKQNDLYFLEIPNSVGEKTKEALRFCSLLPSIIINVNENSLDLNRPLIDSYNPTRIIYPKFDELIWVCKFIKAYESNLFKAGETYANNWDPYTYEAPNPIECFNILKRYTCIKSTDIPSFTSFHTFIKFMNSSFRNMYTYEIFRSDILQQLQGLNSLKHIFCKLLIETAQDFALRNVPRGKQFGNDIKTNNDDDNIIVALPKLSLKKTK